CGPQAARQAVAGINPTHKKTPSLFVELGVFCEAELALRVLRTLTRFAQTDLLTLDFAGIASNETGLAQCRTQRFVVFHQRASDAVADCASLTTHTTTENGDVDVELLTGFSQFKRLTNNHPSGFTTEEVIQLAVVDGDLASTRAQENARGCSLATASAVILSRRHNELFR